MVYNQNKLKLQRMKEELKVKQRQRELSQWALYDYGVKLSTTQNTPNKKMRFSEPVQPTRVDLLPQHNLIENETDFILKVRNKWIHQRNHDNAVKI